MKAFVAPTDQDWFDLLLHEYRRGTVDEVNFWMPSPWGGDFRVLDRGQPLLFKLRAPHNAIAGGGFFSHYTEVPISYAWSAFDIKNGARSLEELRARIGRLRREQPRPWEDYTIGCILLAEPFFWDREDWIPDPPGWSPQIVRGKTYDLTQSEGGWIWDRVTERLEASRYHTGAGGRAGRERTQLELPGGWGNPVTHRPRIGQGIFRSVITDVYGRKCSVTGEKALPVLDAAHIRPFSETAENFVRNGLLLRSDVHRLFDAGYVTVTPELKVEASRRMKDDFNDGDTYLALHGSPVRVPGAGDLRPDPEALRWHNEERFRG
jgi:putative restriction endonuclease